MNRAARNLVRRAGLVLKPLQQAAKRLNQATFGRHLLLTNVTVSVSLSALGDSLQQRYQIERGARPAYDRRRTGYMSGLGLGAGFLCHYWYIALDRWLIGRSVGVVAKKVLVDQVVFSPILITSCLTLLELIRGKSLQDIGSTIKAKFLRLYVAEWTIWPPAQAFSFYCLPLQYRVLWDNTVSLGYDVYYSYVIHDDDDDDDDDITSSPSAQRTAIDRVIYDAKDL